jgi:drug/metabolite transporter, DME family
MMYANIMLTGSRGGVFLVSLAAVLWGTVGIATQAIYQQSELSAVAVGFYRLVFAFPIVALLCWKIVGKKIFQVSARNYLKMIFIGVMLALYQVFYFAAIGYVGVAVATLITLCTAPVLVAIASVVFLKEPLTAATLKALACALLGTILLVGYPGDSVSRQVLFVGVALALGSALGYAVVALIGRSIAQACHPVHSTTVSFGVGALVLFPLAAANLFSISYTMPAWSLLVYVGVVPTAAAYTLFFWGMRNIKASTASILTLLEPLTATILAWFLFAERLAASGFVGAALLLFAIVILYRGEKQSGSK